MEKLVRDKIPGIVRRQLGKATFRTVTGDELRRFLDMKLTEESREWLGSHDIGELADIYEVFLKLAGEYGWSLEEVLIERAEKRRERGGFDDGTVMTFDQLPSTVLRPESEISSEIGTVQLLLRALYRERRGRLLEGTSVPMGWCASCGEVMVDPSRGDDTCGTCERKI